jgi:outer membrane protein OmpA-like peptidoglycan-associated protein
MIGVLTLAGCAMQGKKPQGAAEGAMPTVYLVFFHPRSGELTEDGKGIVDQAAAKVKESKPSTVAIAGYSFNDGAPDDNNRVATERVAAVRSALIADGVDPKLFLDIPIGPAEDDAGRTGDRRVEIRLYRDHP